MAKRLGVKPADLGKDYDVRSIVFDVYVPKAPAGNGKYGLMVNIDFSGSHNGPPTAWIPVFEKRHLIWVDAEDCDEGKPLIQRVGTLLDAIHNGRQVWPLDGDRIYLSGASHDAPASWMDLYYADIFRGGLHSIDWPEGWFTKIPYKGRTFWEFPLLPRPPANILSLAARIPLFVAQRKSSEKPPGESDLMADLMQHGFVGIGIRQSKRVFVPDEQMGHFGDYAAGWFEEGMDFIETHAAPRVAASNATPPAAPAAGPPASAGSPPAGTAASQAARELSMARNYIALKKFDQARPRLEKILSTYPNTPAAQEAKTLLAQIRDAE